VAILGVIWGIVLVIIGALIVAFLGFAGMYFGVFVAIFGASFSAIYISLGVLEFITAWGLLRGKGWAWSLAVTLSLIWIVLCLLWIRSSYVIIAGAAIIIYYLYRPHVKAFFGKGGTYTPPATPQTPPAPPPPPPQQIVQQTPICSRCGKPLTYIEQYGRWYCYTDQRYE